MEIKESTEKQQRSELSGTHKYHHLESFNVVDTETEMGEAGSPILHRIRNQYSVAYTTFRTAQRESTQSFFSPEDLREGWNCAWFFEEVLRMASSYSV